MIATLLLAAGASSRMRGADKMLQNVNGVPLVRQMAARALRLGPTFVTLPPAAHARRSVLPQAAEVVTVDGMLSDSLKAGIDALPPDVTGVLILPADMPEITTDDLALVRDAALAARAHVARGATERGQPGHPVYFAASEFHRFEALSGDQGAGGMIARLDVPPLLVPLPGHRARLDLDTPEDWAAYRAR